MTATERIRAMLDERWVEWKAWDGTYPITVWHDETYLYEFIEYRLVNGAKQVSNCPSDNDGHCELTIKVFNCTTEQAIAATLGTGTCKRVFYEPTGVYVCSKCGRGLSKKLDKYCYLHYCPNCGRRIVQ